MLPQLIVAFQTSTVPFHKFQPYNGIIVTVQLSRDKVSEPYSSLGLHLDARCIYTGSWESQIKLASCMYFSKLNVVLSFLAGVKRISRTCGFNEFSFHYGSLCRWIHTIVSLESFLTSFEERRECWVIFLWSAVTSWTFWFVLRHSE